MPFKVEVMNAAVAQLVEHGTHHMKVGGSVPVSRNLSFHPLSFLHIYITFTTTSYILFLASLSVISH